jgi:hypothetical protein
MTLVEKAARALCRSFIESVAAQEGGWTSATGSIEGDIDLVWRDWLPEVTAVVSVIRDPSELMLKAHHIAPAEWQAVIDALLAEIARLA